MSYFPTNGSIIGAGGLNFWVRNGIRCDSSAIVAREPIVYSRSGKKSSAGNWYLTYQFDTDRWAQLVDFSIYIIKFWDIPNFTLKFEISLKVKTFKR